jgi:hypothetical protein
MPDVIGKTMMAFIISDACTNWDVHDGLESMTLMTEIYVHDELDAMMAMMAGMSLTTLILLCL